MLRDIDPDGAAMTGIISEIRQEVLELVGASRKAFTAIPFEGSGAHGIEAVMMSAVPAPGRILVAGTGAYCRRVTDAARTLGLERVVIVGRDGKSVQAAEVATALAEHPSITHVFMCHCDPMSGVLNSVSEVGAAVRESGKRFVLDATSTLGVLPIDVNEASVDFLIGSSAGPLEGVPGICLVVARLAPLLEADFHVRGVSLDLRALHRSL